MNIDIDESVEDIDFGNSNFDDDSLIDEQSNTVSSVLF